MTTTRRTKDAQFRKLIIPRSSGGVSWGYPSKVVDVLLCQIMRPCIKYQSPNESEWTEVGNARFGRTWLWMRIGSMWSSGSMCLQDRRWRVCELENNVKCTIKAFHLEAELFHKESSLSFVHLVHYRPWMREWRSRSRNKRSSSRNMFRYIYILSSGFCVSNNPILRLSVTLCLL